MQIFYKICFLLYLTAVATSQQTEVFSSSSISDLLENVGFGYIFKNYFNLKCSNPMDLITGLENLETSTIPETLVSVRNLIYKSCPEILDFEGNTVGSLISEAKLLQAAEGYLESVLGKTFLGQKDADSKNKLTASLKMYKSQLASSFAMALYNPKYSLCKTGALIDFTSVTFDTLPCLPSTSSGSTNNNLNLTGKANARVDLKKANLDMYCCGGRFVQNNIETKTDTLTPGDLVNFSFGLSFPSFADKGDYNATVQIYDSTDTVVSCVSVFWTL